MYDPEQLDAHLISFQHNNSNHDNSVSVGMVKIETASRYRLETYKIKNPENILDLSSYLNWIKPYVKEKLTSSVYFCFKVNMMVDCKFFKNGETDVRRFKTRNEPFFVGTDIDIFLNRNFQKLVTEKEECDSKGSGWSLLHPVSYELRKNAFFPVGLCETDRIA